MKDDPKLIEAIAKAIFKARGFVITWDEIAVGVQQEYWKMAKYALTELYACKSSEQND